MIGIDCFRCVVVIQYQLAVSKVANPVPVVPS